MFSFSIINLTFNSAYNKLALSSPSMLTKLNKPGQKSTVMDANDFVLMRAEWERLQQQFFISGLQLLL